MEENYTPLETQSEKNRSVTPSEPEGSKGKGKRHREGLITANKWTPIATQRNRKPQNSASIQVTSASKGTSQRTEKACPEPEELEEDTLDTMVYGQTLREIIPTVPFTFQFNRNLKQEDWKDMDQVLQIHQLLKYLFQWGMDNKRFNLESHWEELGASCQKICLKEIGFKDLMVITKGWNPTRKFRLLEVRANRIRENKATIQAIEEQLNQKGNTQIPSGSQGAGQISSPVASYHSETNRSVANSHHSSQSQEGSRRRQVYKGENKTGLNQRKIESDPMIQKLLDLVEEVHKNQN
ncbi:hypothetical protein O181_024670 [Austropuccinia psidii MF-1]|uniref:Uncharacterized protein n=1 Tax=Austropuccinia psidii MF-1 TaxID=1389203 RepID=A0A9Q3CKZ6_9BASI|nr:hypothetical protein [Austropuccinia psidii MF-1]